MKSDSTGLSKPSKIQAQQIYTISKQRLDKINLGTLSVETMQLVNAALNLHLALK